MICEACKHENRVDAAFCTECGAKFESKSEEVKPEEVKVEESKLEEPKPEEAKAEETKEEAVVAEPAAAAKPPSAIATTIESLKKLPPKKLAILGGAVAAALLLFIIIIAAAVGGGGSNFSMMAGQMQFLQEGSETVIISGNNRIVIDGNLHSRSISMDGTSAAVLTDFTSSGGGTLWFVSGSRATRVADDVFDFMLSDTGRGMLYETDRAGNRVTLNLYDTRRSNHTRISEDALRGDFTISPDGRTVAYVVIEGNNDHVGYMVVNNRRPERLGANIYPAAVSDGGRHLYYFREDGNNMSFHVRSGRNSARLIENMSTWNFPTILFNQDYSQVLFTHEGRTFHSRNGSERERVSALYIDSVVIPPFAQVRIVNFGAVFGISSFANQTVISSGTDGEARLEFIDRRFEATTVSGTAGIRSGQIAENGREMLFINRSGHLMRVNPTRSNAETVEVVRNIRDFVASPDLSHVYFINNDRDLMHVRGNRTPSRIADFASHLVMSPRGNRAFFITDMGSNGGDLQTSNNGNRASRIATDVRNVWSIGSGVLYSNIDNDIYRSNGNANFSRIATDARVR